MQLIKIKYFYVFTVLLSIISLSTVIYLLRWSTLFDESRMSGEVRQNFNFKHIIVHIDLKGAPPKLTYLTQLLAEFKTLGVTALLMEYEDMFPFHGELEVIRASNAYSIGELRNFLISAKKYDIEIIPLVQTFGHLEYVLKHRFHPLREHHGYYSAICPSQNASLVLIQTMIKQVADFHNAVRPLKIFHIGCDEVYYINYCEHCKKRKLTPWGIFVQHVKTVSSYVHLYDTNIRVLIWDDMMRNIDPHKLKQSNIQHYIEPVVWDYTSDISRMVTHRTWYAYSTVFHKIWIASAFKGADGITQLMPNLENRFNNHLSWMKFVTTYKAGGMRKFLNLEGIFMTGWSRYDHTQPLCEILPIGMPSLVLNIMLIKAYSTNTSIEHYNHNVLNMWLEYMHCPESLTNKSNDNTKYNTLNGLRTSIILCEFPLNDLYRMFVWIKHLEKTLQISSEDNFTSEMFRMIDGIMGNNVEEILIKLKKMELILLPTLLNYFDKLTTTEILNLRINPLKRRIEKMLKIKLINWNYIRQAVVETERIRQTVVGTERIRHILYTN